MIATTSASLDLYKKYILVDAIRARRIRAMNSLTLALIYITLHDG